MSRHDAAIIVGADSTTHEAGASAESIMTEIESLLVKKDLEDGTDKI